MSRNISVIGLGKLGLCLATVIAILGSNDPSGGPPPMG